MTKEEMKDKRWKTRKKEICTHYYIRSFFTIHIFTWVSLNDLFRFTWCGFFSLPVNCFPLHKNTCYVITHTSLVFLHLWQLYSNPSPLLYIISFRYTACSPWNRGLSLKWKLCRSKNKHCLISHENQHVKQPSYFWGDYTAAQDFVMANLVRACAKVMRF